MTWFIILLKDFYLFKIVELKFFLKQKLITDSAILNKWESFSRIVDKWSDPLEDLIISPVSETKDGAVLKNYVTKSKQKRREK